MNRGEDAQLPVFPDQLMLYRFETSRVRRAYLTVQRDLFGEAILVLECGWLGSPGRLVRRRFVDEGLAVTAVLELARELAQRGYVMA